MEEIKRKLATVRKVRDTLPIEGADLIEIALIDGWQCITAKSNGIKKGDLVIYCEIDSIMPEHPEFEFLRDKKFRIKTIRLKGQLSQGIIFPLSILMSFECGMFSNYTLENKILIDGKHVFIEEGLDLTDALGITKFEAPISAQLSGQVKGRFPIEVPRSDEERIQNLVDEIERYRSLDLEFVGTEKLDGCLEENTLIETEDGIKTIKEICEKKYSKKIKSYNIEKNKIIWDKIINHSIKDSNNDIWYEIELNNGLKIKLTENHRVFLPNLLCFREIKDLNINDELLIEN